MEARTVVLLFVQAALAVVALHLLNRRVFPHMRVARQPELVADVWAPLAMVLPLLFLAAGSVIIAMHHDQDIRNMGGIRKYMPITWITFLIGTLALIGFPGFSGFFSKDSCNFQTVYSGKQNIEDNDIRFKITREC